MRFLYVIVASVMAVGLLGGADTAPHPTPILLRSSDAKPKSTAFDPPAILEAKGGFAIYNPPAEVVEVEYVALDGEEPFPVSQIGGSKTAFVFFTRGLPAKNYRFVGIASDSGGKLTRRQFSVPVGTPPVVTPPKPKDPPVVTPPAATYYFLLVRPDGPATASFTKIKSDPAWKELQKAGHKVGDMGVTDAGLIVGIAVPDILPCVITLVENPATKKSTVVRPAIALPATGPAILDLPKGVTK